MAMATELWAWSWKQKLLGMSQGLHFNISAFPGSQLMFNIWKKIPQNLGQSDEMNNEIFWLFNGFQWWPESIRTPWTIDKTVCLDWSIYLNISSLVNWFHPFYSAHSTSLRGRCTTQLWLLNRMMHQDAHQAVRCCGTTIFDLFSWRKIVSCIWHLQVLQWWFSSMGTDGAWGAVVCCRYCMNR